MADVFNSKMLTLARESRGFTQTGLAELLGTNQSTYSRYENDLRSPSDADIKRFAGTLNYPTKFFAQTDSVHGFASAVFYHRKRARLPMGSLRTIQAKLNIFRFHAIRLAAGVEIEQSLEVPHLPVGEAGTPEQIANLVRVAWKLPFGPIDNLVDLLEDAGVMIRAVDLGTRDIDAVVQVGHDLTPVMLVNKLTSGERLRFTMAHELGHLVMHQLPNENMEQEADAFAAELLMPSREIKSQLRQLSVASLPDLKMHWKVSMAALVRRARDVGSITERQYRSLFMRFGQLGWRTKEAYPLDSERPVLIDDMVQTYRQQYGYSVAEMASTVNATESAFREDYLTEEADGPRLATIA